MKSKILLAGSFFAMALLCQPSVNAQVTNSTPARPRPETGKPKPTGTVTGGLQNIVNSKLLIYVKNGLATTSTNTSGEIPSQLTDSATVNGEFYLQWTRTKPGKAEKGTLYITPANSNAWVAGPSVAMPAQGISINIPYSMPNLPPKTYELKVAADSGSSSKVTINYTGNGANGPVVLTPAPTGGSIAATKAPFYVTRGQFTPMVGAPGVAGYKRARLTLTLGTDITTTISKIEVEVWSERWSNSELITNSNSKNSPIIIFRGRWTAPGGPNGKYDILKDKENPITIVLNRTTKNDVDGQESDLGVYSPGDWGRAFVETTTASFRWNVNGKLSGSFDKSPMKPWVAP